MELLLGWLALLAEPALLAAAVVGAGLPLLLLPGTAGMMLSACVVGALLWLNHRVESSARNLPVRVGPEAMVGRRARVLERLAPVGVVICDGELWRAVEVSGREIGPDEEAEVMALRGLLLEVKPVGGR